MSSSKISGIIKIVKNVYDFIKELFSFRKLRKYILQKKIEAKQKEVAKALSEGRIEDAGYLQAEVRKLYEEFSLFEEIKDAIKTKLDKDKLSDAIENTYGDKGTTNSVEPLCLTNNISRDEFVKVNSIKTPTPRPAVDSITRTNSLKAILQKEVALMKHHDLEIKGTKDIPHKKSCVRSVDISTKLIIVSVIFATLSGCKTYQPDYKTPEDLNDRVKIVKPGDTIVIPDLTEPAKTWYLVDDIGLSTWLGIPEEFLDVK